MISISSNKKERTKCTDPLTMIIGLVLGVANFLMPGKDRWDILTMLLGIAGSFVGTYLGRIFGHYQDGSSAGSLCR